MRDLARLSNLIKETQDLNPSRHCGLDPQSPEQKGVVFALRRWRMFLRHDGKGLRIVIPMLNSICKLFINIYL